MQLFKLKPDRSWTVKSFFPETKTDGMAFEDMKAHGLLVLDQYFDNGLRIFGRFTLSQDLLHAIVIKITELDH